MKIFKTLAFVVVALMLAASPGFAQTATTTTTITEPLTSPTQTTVVVASATGITASTASAQRFVLVDRELMQVRAVSGTTLTVQRAVGGTFATEHSDNANLVYGPAGTWNSNTGSATGVFISGATPVGACTATESQYLPIFHTGNGKQYDCLSSEWVELAGPFTGTSVFVFEGSTRNTSETTLALAEPTADRTITLPNASGIVGVGMTIDVIFCGDQANATTTYTSPVSGYPAGAIYGDGLTANDLSYLLAGTGCAAEDNTTEGTADEVMFANNALKVLGMYCTVSGSGSNGVTLRLRSATANLTPDVAITIPTGQTTGATVTGTTTDIAAGATVAVANVTTEDLSAQDFWCMAKMQVIP